MTAQDKSYTGKKIKIGDSKMFKDPTVPKGWSRWIENGVWFKAPTVDRKLFGSHHYNNADGTGNCQCGCYMGGFSSDGPVDPFGACPANPKASSDPKAANKSNATRVSSSKSSPSSTSGGIAATATEELYQILRNADERMGRLISEGKTGCPERWAWIEEIRKGYLILKKEAAQ